MTTALDRPALNADPHHAQALADLDTIADRVRYACEHNPDGPRTDSVRQWLALYGYATKRPYVSTLVTGYRSARSMEDTGDLPVLTPDALAELDAAAEAHRRGDDHPDWPAPTSPAPAGWPDPDTADASGRPDSGPDPAPRADPLDLAARLDWPAPTYPPPAADPGPARAPWHTLTRPDTTPAGRPDSPASGTARPAAPAAPAAPVAARPARRDGRRPRAQRRVWPMFLIALPAFVAVWSGWVGMGRLTGFGLVNLLPGIVADGGWSTIDTSITLPIGVEAYGAYALSIWLAGRVPGRARRFAFWSAIASLGVGMIGQAAYHLMIANPAWLTREAGGQLSAPWPIVVLVSCLPVAVFGLGCALAHLVRTAEDPDPDPAEQTPQQR